MASTSYVARFPAGSAGMTARRNRSLIAPEEYIVAENVSFAGNMVSRLLGATQVYYFPTVTSVAYSFSSTLSISDGWASSSYLFYGTGTSAAWQGGIATNTASNTAGTSLTITLTETHDATNGPYVDSSSILFVARTFGVDITSVVDSAGRVWRLVGGQISTPDSTYSLQVYMADQDPHFPDLATDGTITITFASTCAALAAVASTSARSTTLQVAATTATNTAATSALESVQAGGTAMVVLLTDAVGNVSTTPSGWTERIEITPATSLPGIHVYTQNTTVGESTIACTEFYPRSSSTLTGSIAVTAGSANITGSGGSLLSTELRVGDDILINSTGERRTCATSTSASAATATVAFNVTAAAAGSRTAWQGQRLIWAAENGRLYKSYRTGTAVAPVSLATDLAAGARTGFFLHCGMEATGSSAKLFYMNGTDTVREMTGDGDTVSAIANPNTDWAVGNTPSGGAVHQGRVFLFGTRSNPFTLYASDPADHEDFRTANTATRRYQVDSSVGTRIIAAASFQGVLFIWKHPRGIFYLDDSDLTSANWSLQTKSRSLGCANSPHAVLQMDDDIMFLDASGQFHLLSAVDSLGGVKDSNLSAYVGIEDWMRDNVSHSQLETVCSYWDAARKIAHWGIPIGAGLRPINLLMFDFSGTSRGEPVKVSINTRDVPSAICGTRNIATGITHPLVAEPGNRFTTLDQPIEIGNVTLKPTPVTGDQSYTTILQTPYTDFAWMDPSFEFKRKIFEALEIEFEPLSNPDDQAASRGETVKVQVWIDRSLRQTLSFTPTNRRERRALQCGDGYTFSLRVYSSATPEQAALTTSNNFQIIAHNVWFQEGAEDFSRTA